MIFMDKEPMFGLIKEFTTEVGEKTRCTGKVKSYGKTEESTLE